MSEPLTKLYMKFASVKSAASAGRTFLESYPVDEILLKAKHGRAALYPFSDLDEYGRALLGADIGVKQTTRFHTLDQLVLLPPIFTPKRLEKLSELGREPFFSDVDLETNVGGFRSRLPLTMASMGSTEVAHRASPELGKGAAEAEIPMGLGENIATVWGYARREKSSMPSFKQRLFAYLDQLEGKHGGVVIQQSVEDAFDELWNKVYTDPDVEPFVRKGLVAFEVKLGQGAKPGLGGETKVPREVAKSLKGKYYFPDDPERVNQDLYERHSAPGTYTQDILQAQLRSLRNNFPRVRIWIKTGPFRDLLPLLRVAGQEKVDAILIDGKEGGTGMSPVIALKDLGLPTLACLKRIDDARVEGLQVPSVLSGRLYDGGHVVKALALGASACSFGRPFILAVSVGGAKGVLNFLEATETEMRMLVSALGKYRASDVAREDVGSLDRHLADGLNIPYVYG
ncbi:MAG TPA: alpha-hydroxy-acid oxidizing protein [Thermoplasmata archaeon]|nr:alpha-hydroxy-acid oxidizing protein [Thermoplasmata archaeon]